MSTAARLGQALVVLIVVALVLSALLRWHARHWRRRDVDGELRQIRYLEAMPELLDDPHTGGTR